MRHNILYYTDSGLLQKGNSYVPKIQVRNQLKYPCQTLKEYPPTLPTTMQKTYQCNSSTTGLCDQKNRSNSLLTCDNPSSSEHRAYHKDLCKYELCENHKHLLNGIHNYYVTVILPCSSEFISDKVRDQILGDRERKLFYSSLSPEPFRS